MVFLTEAAVHEAWLKERALSHPVAERERARGLPQQFVYFDWSLGRKQNAWASESKYLFTLT